MTHTSSYQQSLTAAVAHESRPRPAAGRGLVPDRRLPARPKGAPDPPPPARLVAAHRDAHGNCPHRVTLRDPNRRCSQERSDRS